MTTDGVYLEMDFKWRNQINAPLEIYGMAISKGNPDLKVAL